VKKRQKLRTGNSYKSVSNQLRVDNLRQRADISYKIQVSSFTRVSTPLDVTSEYEFMNFQLKCFFSKRFK